MSVTRRPRSRNRQRQINILHTTARKQHSQKKIMQWAGWIGLVLAMTVVVGVGLHLGINLVLDRLLFTNDHYALNEIEIEPRGHFSEALIRQAAGLKTGQNLWTLSLPQIRADLEKLPSVSSARVERHFPDKITISIVERVPVVKIVGLNVDLNTRETFYLDRDCIVLKPREDESPPPMPEIIGLTNAELEPGAKLDQPGLVSALQILDAIDHSNLHTQIDMKTVDLSDPLSITMVTTHDLTIVFRLDYIDEQLRRLKIAFNQADSMQRTLRSVDLTPNLNDPITFNN